MHYSTAELARELHSSTGRVTTLIAKNRIPVPAKNSSGQYIWTREDIDRTARLLPTEQAGRQSPKAPRESAAAV
jgi:hypothetical protein